MRAASICALAATGLAVCSLALEAAGPRIYRFFPLLPSEATPVIGGEPKAAQRAPQQSESPIDQPNEVVADLAAGRVYIVIAKNGIVVGAAGVAAEPGSIAPPIVEMGERKLGVLMGAVIWKDPDSGQQLAALGEELARLRPLTGKATPQLSRESTEGVATDIETTGLGVFERLRGLAAMLHGPLPQDAKQMVLRVILADYVENYGPEVWELDYSLTQEEVQAGSGYLETKTARPRYTQLWPPEKGQPHSILALSYPAQESGNEEIANLIHAAEETGQDASAIAAVRQAIQGGDTRGLDANDAATFLKAALIHSAGQNGNYAIAAIGETTGFAWIVKPAKPESGKTRPAGAPTLIKP